MTQQTGRIRYRVQKWTGKLVLQVEFRGMFTTNCCGCIDTETRSWWRDAVVEDGVHFGILRVEHPA